MIEKRAETSVEIADIIALRWSVRAFDSSYRLSKEQIAALCEAARWAPSSMGDEPWNFVIFDRNEGEDFWARAVECLTTGNQFWANNASCLFAVYACQSVRNGSDPNGHGDFDTGAACQNIYLQAVAMGLTAHPMGGFIAEKINALTGAPESVRLRAVIAVGKHADSEGFNDRIKRHEAAPRKRLPLSTNFFSGKWGAGL